MCVGTFLRQETSAIVVLFFVVLLVATQVLSTATTVYVPDDYPTIQQAVDAASPGDIIRVAQGTYRELLFITASLTLEGGWDASFTSRSTDPSLTIIDGSGIGNVIFINGVFSCDITVIIDSFSITGGQAFDGAGLHVEATGSASSVNVTLTNTIITASYANYGGGISAAASNSGSTTLQLNNNSISNTRAYNCGGGIAINADTSGSVTVVSNNNAISANTGDRGGGAIYLNSVGTGASIDFTSNNDVINHNQAGYGYAGGGISTYSESGADLNLNINGCTINDNDATPGAGISMQPNGSNVNVTIQRITQRAQEVASMSIIATLLT